MVAELGHPQTGGQCSQSFVSRGAVVMGVTGEWGTGPGFWWPHSRRGKWRGRSAGTAVVQEAGLPGAENGGSAVPRVVVTRGGAVQGGRGGGHATSREDQGSSGRGRAMPQGPESGRRPLGTCARELRVPHPRLTPGGTTLELAAGRRSLCSCSWSQSGAPSEG